MIALHWDDVWMILSTVQYRYFCERFFKNENFLNDMADIVDDLHKYISKTTSPQTLQVRVQRWHVRSGHSYHILIGGDQLTAARIRGGQWVLSNSTSGGDHGEILIPIIEDCIACKNVLHEGMMCAWQLWCVGQGLTNINVFILILIITNSSICTGDMEKAIQDLFNYRWRNSNSAEESDKLKKCVQCLQRPQCLSGLLELVIRGHVIAAAIQTSD